MDRNKFDCHIQDAHINKDIYDCDVLNLIQDVSNLRVFHKECKPEWFQNHYEVDDNQSIVLCPESSYQYLQGEFDSLISIKESRLALLYKSSSFPHEKDLFIRNMTGNMWLYLVGVLILLALCLRLSTHTHHALKPRHGDWSWSEVIQWTLGAVCQQGSAKHPQGCSCRTMFVIGYLITYLIYTGYAAGITSLLAVRTDSQQLPWHNAISLRLPFTTLCSSDGEIYLKSRELSHQGSAIPKCVNTLDHLVATVLDSNAIAVVTEETLQRYLINCISGDERCQMSISKQTHRSYYNGFIIKRNYALRKKLNYWILRLKEHGLLKRLLKQSQEPLSTCEMPPGYTEVGFEHVKSAFFILFVHMIIAIFIFLAELLFIKVASF